MENRHEKWFLSEYDAECKTQNIFALLGTEREVKVYMANMVKTFLAGKGTGHGTDTIEQVKKPADNLKQDLYACAVSGKEEYNISAFRASTLGYQ